MIRNASLHPGKRKRDTHVGYYTDKAEAQQIHEQFRNLPSKSDLEKRLQDRQRDFTGGSIDKWSRVKIDALFARTRLLMDNYIDLNLDAELIREVPQTAEEAAASAQTAAQSTPNPP